MSVVFMLLHFACMFWMLFLMMDCIQRGYNGPFFIAAGALVVNAVFFIQALAKVLE